MDYGVIRQECALASCFKSSEILINNQMKCTLLKLLKCLGQNGLNLDKGWSLAGPLPGADTDPKLVLVLLTKAKLSAQNLADSSMHKWATTSSHLFPSVPEHSRMCWRSATTGPTRLGLVFLSLAAACERHIFKTQTRSHNRLQRGRPWMAALCVPQKKRCSLFGQEEAAVYTKGVGPAHI